MAAETILNADYYRNALYIQGSKLGGLDTKVELGVWAYSTDNSGFAKRLPESRTSVELPTLDRGTCKITNVVSETYFRVFTYTATTGNTIGNQMIKDIRVDFLIDKEVQLDASCCKDNSVPSEVSLRKCQY